jgi:hypothetical protein
VGDPEHRAHGNLPDKRVPVDGDPNPFKVCFIFFRRPERSLAPLGSGGDSLPPEDILRVFMHLQRV